MHLTAPRALVTTPRFVPAEERPLAGCHDPSCPVACVSTRDRALLLCGGVGSLLFTATYLIAGATRPGYDAGRQPISALSLGPGGWVQAANFIVFGVLIGVAALGWRAVLAPGPGATAIPVLRALAALGLITDGLFAQDPAHGYPVGVVAAATPTLHGTVHQLAAVVAITALAASSVVFAARFARAPGWRAWTPVAAAAGVLTIVFIAAFGATLAHGPAGLFERLAGGTQSLFSLAVVARLIAGWGRVVAQGRPVAASGGVGWHRAPGRRVTSDRPTGRWTGATQRQQRLHGRSHENEEGTPMGTDTPPAERRSAGAAERSGLTRWLVGAVVVLGALVTGLTGVLSLVAPATFLALVGHRGEPLSAGARVFADYAGARELAIAVALVVLLVLRSRRVLPGLMVVTAGANAVDAGGAVAAGRWVQLPGAVVFALIFLATAAWLFTHPLVDRSAANGRPFPRDVGA